MHPYKDLLPDSFWRTAVADINPLEIEGLWKPKLSLTPDDAVVTAGSCFAQHIGKALVKMATVGSTQNPHQHKQVLSSAENSTMGYFLSVPAISIPRRCCSNGVNGH